MKNETIKTSLYQFSVGECVSLFNPEQEIHPTDCRILEITEQFSKKHNCHLEFILLEVCESKYKFQIDAVDFSSELQNANNWHKENCIPNLLNMFA